MTQSQLRNAENRGELEDQGSWHRDMPEGVDKLLKMLICHGSEITKERLGAMPNVSAEGRLKLQSLAEKCDSVLGNSEKIFRR